MINKALASDQFKGFSALLISAIIYAMFGLFVRELNQMFGEYTQIVARSVVAVLILACLILLKKSNIFIQKKQRIGVILFSITFPIAVVFFTLSINETKIANTVFMLYAGNIVTSFLLGTIVLKEKLNLFKIISIVFVTIGLVVFANPFGSISFGIGAIFGIFSGVFEGITSYLRKAVQDVKREVLLFYQYTFGAILGTTLAILFSEDSYKTFDLSAFITLIVFGALLVVLGNLLLYGFRHYDVNVGTIVLASEILFSVIVGFIFLSESPTLNEIIGGVIIFFAAILSNVEASWLKKKLRLNKFNTDD